MGCRKNPEFPPMQPRRASVNDFLTAMHNHSVATLCSNFRQIANSLLPCAFTLQNGGRRRPGDVEGGMTELAKGKKRPSVLIVEDEAMICEMAAEVLAEQGFKV